MSVKARIKAIERKLLAGKKEQSRFPLYVLQVEWLKEIANGPDSPRSKELALELSRIEPPSTRTPAEMEWLNDFLPLNSEEPHE